MPWLQETSANLKTAMELVHDQTNAGPEPDYVVYRD
jgi:hypothetical protein